MLLQPSRIRMSPMQKFSPEQVEKVIVEIEKSSQLLYELVSKNQDNESNMDKIIELLDQREPLFQIFSLIVNDESLEIYFRNNYNRWLNRVKKILELEKFNLEIIEKNMKLHFDKVKDINKQKQLLLYKKREI